MITTTTWALLHTQYDWFYILILMLGGIFLGVVRLKTGSTTLTIWLHALINVIATLELIIKVEFLKL